MRSKSMEQSPVVARPEMDYALCHPTSNTSRKYLQVIQSNVLRMISRSSWYIKNPNLYRILPIVRNLSSNRKVSIIPTTSSGIDIPGVPWRSRWMGRGTLPLHLQVMSLSNFFLHLHFCFSLLFYFLFFY